MKFQFIKYCFNILRNFHFSYLTIPGGKKLLDKEKCKTVKQIFVKVSTFFFFLVSFLLNYVQNSLF